MFSEDRKEQQPYHHGNVKEALISKAMKLIEANEIELLSLRRLARDIGVSPSAVYNHFPDKNALMLAIKIRLYEQFNDYFEQHCHPSDDPVNALLEMCQSYYHFSREQPSQFQLLFSSTLPLEWSTQDLVAVSCRTIVRLRKLVLAIYERYQIPCREEDIVNTTLLIWSQLHGIIYLKASGGIKAAVTYQNWPQSCALVDDKDVERLIKNHVDMTVHAILNSQYSDGHH